MIAVDLPGFGETPPLPGEVSIATLADAVTSFLEDQRLTGIDAVGSSMGARLVLELARRGVLGSVVSLDPGGFWQGWERPFFRISVGLSYRLVKALHPVLPFLTSNPVTRTALLIQFSARPWKLPPAIALTELRSFGIARSFLPLLHSLVNGPEQEGIAAGSAAHPIVIGWGRQDRVCIPRQANRAAGRFPDARFHWFERCGYFPGWDAPEETIRVILEATAWGVSVLMCGACSPAPPGAPLHL